MSDPHPSDHTSPLGRVMPCPDCLHDEHLMPCGAEIIPGVLCRCRDVPVPGLYPAA